MKKLQVFGVSLFLFLLIFCLSLVSAVRINEVMPNPADNCSDCTEWIELYSDSALNITNWIINTTNQQTNFSFYMEEFLIITQDKAKFLDYWDVDENDVIEWTGMSLKNSGEGIFLFDNTFTLVSDVIYPSFSSQENKTYSLLSNLSWIICDEPTPGQENLCEEEEPEQNETEQNETQNETEIYLELDYDNEVVNGEEFKVEVRAYNLKNESYDVKVFITFEDEDTTISETYHDEDNKWKSSTYYVNEVFVIPGNESENLKLRIKEENKNFSGKAEIKAKIRELNGEVIADFKGNIELLETTKEEINQTGEIVNSNETKSIIKLNEPKNIKTSNQFKSKTQLIKEYAIYGFTLFCVLVIIMLIIKTKLRKFRWQKKKT